MQIPEARYDALTDAVFDLYELGRFAEALDLLRPADPELAPWPNEFKALLREHLAAPSTPL